MADHPRVGIALIGVLVFSVAVGCTEVSQTYQRLTSYVDPTEERIPGEKMKRSAEDIAGQEECVSPYFRHVRLAASEISPKAVSPGDQVNHRLIYVACPQAVGAGIRGTLTTTVSYGYRKMLRDPIRGFAMKPGEWIVDADIVIPPTAELGRYVLEVEFRGAGFSLYEATPFTVTARND